jgi:hypothetical protein
MLRMTRPVSVVILGLSKHDNHHFRQHEKQKTPGINIHGVFHLKVVELEGSERYSASYYITNTYKIKKFSTKPG